MQNMVKFSQHMIDCNPRVDSFLLARYDFHMSCREEKLKLQSQVNTKITQYSFLISAMKTQTAHIKIM